MGMFDQQPGMFTDPLGGGGQSGLGGLAGILGEYLRNVMSGQIAANGALGQNNYDPNRSFAQNALDPKALANATDIAMGVSGGGLGIRAYHGSPHDFDRFDISKIGTGEGAQAYGHGLYFAEAEDVARGYRDTLAGKAPLKEYGSQPLETNRDWYGLLDKVEPQDWRLARIIDAAGKQGGIRTALDTFEPHTRNASDGPLWAAAIEKFKEGVGPAAKGRMYEVEIHADPNAFLNWDKPLMDQPQAVQDVVSRVLSPAPPVIATDVRRGTLGGGGTYQALAERFAGPVAEDVPGVPRGWGAVAGTVNDRAYNGAAATQALNEAGIPGIKYLDQGSRGAGAGTSNYVVFDPSIIEILRKYGILGPVAAPGALMPFMGDQQP